MTLSTGVGSEVTAGKQVILLFDLMHSCPFVVQISFPWTLPKLLTPRSVLSLPSPNNSLDSVLRTSFHDEPKNWEQLIISPRRRHAERVLQMRYQRW